MNCVSRRCESPRQIPAPWGEEARLGNRGLGSCSRERTRVSPAGQECRLESPCCLAGPPGAAPGTQHCVPPGRTEHVVDVSTSQPFPAACFLEKEDQQSPQRNHGYGGFSILQGDGGSSLLAGSRPALLLKARIRGTGQLCWGWGGLSAELRLQWADGQGQSPRPGSPGTLEAGGPSCGYCADARFCFTCVSQFSGCWGE